MSDSDDVREVPVPPRSVQPRVDSSRQSGRPVALRTIRGNTLKRLQKFILL